ncbi:hypothetical protein ACETIH_04685 [Microvirga arabica]|uniref:Uncharacterized protein n=1 Tax=Microvirga arabica TaxID=1128671 RepID=A0ABV6Y4U1_9HYPH
MRAIKRQPDENAAVEANAATGEVRVDASADPPMAVIAMMTQDDAGCSVDEVRTRGQDLRS